MFGVIGLDVVVNLLISSLDGIRVVVLMINHLVIYKRKFLMDVLYATISLFKNRLSIK